VQPEYQPAASNLNLLQSIELVEVVAEAFAVGLRGNEKKCKRRFTSTVKEVTHSTEAWRRGGVSEAKAQLSYCSPNSLGAILATTNSVIQTTGTNQKGPYGCIRIPSINALRQSPNSNTVNRSHSLGGVS